MKKKYKWGIIGPGAISETFVKDLKLVEEAEVYAVGSRRLEKAVEYANKYDIPKAYGSYEELLEDSEVDIVYIATPHPFHKEWVIKSLKAGKAVLCEKPIVMNAGEAKEIIDCARENNVFFMEAMWSRFLPTAAKVREWVESGAIGEVRMVKADFGFRCDWNPEGRLLNPNLGGGALLDVGIYVHSFASMILKKQPKEVVSLVHIGETGVDEQETSVLKYDNGEIAVLGNAVRTNMPQDAYILGTKGNIKIPMFWCARSATLTTEDGESEIYEVNFDGSGYTYEAREVMNCLDEGKKESDLMPLEESLAIMRTMDLIRKQWGLTYPCER